MLVPLARTSPTIGPTNLGTACGRPQVADQMSLRSDSSGTRVVVTFSLDAIP